MVEIEKPRIESNEKDGDISYGKSVVEPLEHGYGTTLGNALRRILLSSLPGTAVTTIKIAGVQHEFSTIPGVKEDVTQIVLNVKGHYRQAPLPRAPKPGVYRTPAGEGEVTAGDIKADGEVEILNPELHIATLMRRRYSSTWSSPSAMGAAMFLRIGTSTANRLSSVSFRWTPLYYPGLSGELHRGEHPCRQHDRL